MTIKSKDIVNKGVCLGYLSFNVEYTFSLESVILSSRLDNWEVFHILLKERHYFIQHWHITSSYNSCGSWFECYRVNSHSKHFGVIAEAFCGALTAFSPNCGIIIHNNDVYRTKTKHYDLNAIKTYVVTLDGLAEKGDKYAKANLESVLSTLEL